MAKALKITIAHSRLAAVIDQTAQLKELGFDRDGHIEITFLSDSVAPRTLYIQKLKYKKPTYDHQTIPGSAKPIL